MCTTITADGKDNVVSIPPILELTRNAVQSRGGDRPQVVGHVQKQLFGPSVLESGKQLFCVDFFSQLRTPGSAVLSQHPRGKSRGSAVKYYTRDLSNPKIGTYAIQGHMKMAQLISQSVLLVQ